MAVVSDTSSSSPARWSSPSDPRSTQPSPLAPDAFGGGPSLESIIVTAAAAASTPVSAGGSSLHPGEAAEGRVARQARRRPRASRKAPVTLLNTDTTNFRAMVQQFTGFPAAAQQPPPPPPPPQYASSYGLRPGFSLSIFNDPSPPPRPPLAHFLQRPQYLELQQQQQQQMQYHFPDTAMFRADWNNNNNSSSIGGGQNEAFLHNTAGSSGNLETMAADHDVFLFGGQMSSSMMRRNSSDSASRVHDEYYSP